LDPALLSIQILICVRAYSLQRYYQLHCNFYLQYYFYLPILVLLCFNSLLFMVTVFKLWMHGRETQIATARRISLNASRRDPSEVLTWVNYFTVAMLHISITLPLSTYMTTNKIRLLILKFLCYRRKRLKGHREIVWFN